MHKKTSFSNYNFFYIFLQCSYFSSGKNYETIHPPSLKAEYYEALGKVFSDMQFAKTGWCQEGRKKKSQKSRKKEYCMQCSMRFGIALNMFQCFVYQMTKYYFSRWNLTRAFHNNMAQVQVSQANSSHQKHHMGR